MALKSEWSMLDTSSMCLVELKPMYWIVSGFKSCTASALNGSFRPEAQIRKLRTYMRLRDNLVVEHTQAIDHVQKALFEMNVQLSNVISDISGESGLRITHKMSHSRVQLRVACRKRDKGRQSGHLGR
jgi:hypothetical protein